MHSLLGADAPFTFDPLLKTHPYRLGAGLWNPQAHTSGPSMPN
jgi:hypothetical protein